MNKQIVPTEVTLQWIKEWEKLPITCDTPHSCDFIADRAAQWALEQAAREPVLSEAISNPASDDDWQWIENRARITLGQHGMRVRGTTMTRADDRDSHIVWAALAWARNKLEKIV